MNNNQEEFLRTLGKISATLSGLCLTMLIFSIGITNPDHHWDIIRNSIWWAVILFAITTFRCIDKILDKITEKECYAKFLPSEKGWKWGSNPRKLIAFDERINWEHYGFSVVFFFIAWIFFSVAVLFLGLIIGLGWQSYFGFVVMCVFAILFVTYHILTVR